MRFALVGCGVIAREYAQSLESEPLVELAGATDVETERAAELTARFGGTTYASLEALLADDTVEAVVNLTVPHAHAEVTRTALEAGRHVHSEKPLALRYDEAKALVELAAARGLCLSCSPSTLLGEAQQTAWKLLRDGAVGTVRVAYAEVNWGRIESWHPRPAGLHAVGALVDVGVYPLTLLTAFLGPVRRVTALAHLVSPDRVTQAGEHFRLERPDLVVAVLELESGVVARLTTTFYVEHYSYQRGIEFHGDLGGLHLASWGEFDSRLELALVGEQYARVTLVREPYRGIAWSRALGELADAVAEGRPHRTSGEHAAHVVEILCAAEESVERGAPVDVRSDFRPPRPLEWAM